MTMKEEYIEMLIESIITFDEMYKPQYFILFYLPSSEEFNISEELYFAVLAAKIKPNDSMISDVLYETKDKIGNIVYAAEYEILKKTEAIQQLEDALDYE